MGLREPEKEGGNDISFGTDRDDSWGSGLKKLSSFLTSRVSAAFIQPTDPLLVFTMYHVSPPAPMTCAIDD
jgi:hypothetical protein